MAHTLGGRVARAVARRTDASMADDDDVPPNVTFAYAVGDHVVSELFAGVAVIKQIANTKSRTDANDKACSIIYLKREHKHVPMDPQYIYSNDPFTIYAASANRAEQPPGAVPAGRPRRRTAAAIAAEKQATAQARTEAEAQSRARDEAQARARAHEAATVALRSEFEQALTAARAEHEQAHRHRRKQRSLAEWSKLLTRRNRSRRSGPSGGTVASTSGRGCRRSGARARGAAPAVTA